jgi:hypothetical protein
LCPEGFSRGCRVFSSNVYITKIIVHKADEPNAIFYLFDTDSLAARLELKDSQLGRRS